MSSERLFHALSAEGKKEWKKMLVRMLRILLEFLRL